VAVPETVGVAVTLVVVAAFVVSVPLVFVDVEVPHAVKIADAIKIIANFFMFVLIYYI
jgi:hypothetical protein